MQGNAYEKIVLSITVRPQDTRPWHKQASEDFELVAKRFEMDGFMLNVKVSWFRNVFLVSSNWPKNQWNLCKDFCPSLQKEVKSKKVTFIFKELNINQLKYQFIFLFNFFLEARAGILTKISLVLWSIWRHQKVIFKLTDLYLCS